MTSDLRCQAQAPARITEPVAAPAAAPLDCNKQNLPKPNLPRQYLLGNGLKVILLADKAYPYICCSTWYKVGSRDDPAKMTGLTHLVEHLLFQNVGSFQSNQLIDLIVRHGGEFSGFTSEDFTTLYVNLPTKELELAIRGQAECMRAAHFTKDDVQKEVVQLVKESQSEDQDVLAALNKEVHALAYEQHPYHNPPGGWHYDIEHLTYEEARTHYDRYFQPNNACVVLAGGFDESTAIKLIDKYFGVLPKAANLQEALYSQERPQLAERQIKLKAPGNKESIMMAYRVPGVDDNDAPVFTILEQLLNAQPHGRLHSKLVETGLCSSAQAYFEIKHDPGLFVIKCTGIPANGSTKVVQALDGILSQFRAKPLASGEVDLILKQSELAYYCDGNGPYPAAFQAGFFESLDSNGNQAYVWPHRLRKVTSASILQVARHYLNDENRVLGKIITNTSDNNKSQTGANKKSSCENTLIAAGMHLRLAAYQDSITNSPPSPLTNNHAVKADDHIEIGSSEISRKILNNGINVIVIESHLKPIVYMYGAIKAGSIFDRADCHGVAKLLTNIFNNGNSVANAQLLTTEQNDFGLPLQTMLTFRCHLENILFNNRFLSADLESQLRHLLTTISQSQIQVTDLEGQKNDLISNIRAGETNTDERIRRAVLDGLVSANCAYHPIHPEQEIDSISNIKITDLQDFYRMHVNPAATTLVVAGDVNAKQIFALLEDMTRNWSNATSTQNNSPSNIDKNKIPYIPQLIVSNRQASKSSIFLPQNTQSQVVLARIIPVTSEKQAQAAWAALQLADCVMSSHPIFSRLAEEFEAKPELLVDTDSKPWTTKMVKLANNLVWSMRINLKPTASSSAAVAAIQDELVQFGQSGLTAEDLAEARQYLAGSLPIRECFSLDKLARFTFHGFDELNEIDLLTKIQKIMAALNSTDVNQFISRMFKPQDAAIVVAGPKQLIKQIHPSRDSLESD